MDNSSAKAVPLKSKWFFTSKATGFFKEVLGFKSLFHWHCGRRMIRVINYQTFHEDAIVITRTGCHGWICPVCERRKEKTFEMM